MKLTKLLILLLLLSLKGLAQTPTFGNTGAITLCQNGSYFLDPSTTNGTWFSSNPSVASVNSSGYVTGVSVGTTTVSFVATVGGGTVTATVTVVASLSPSLSITDPLAQPSYKINNNPQGPIGGTLNYVGYNGYSYSSQARPINKGFFRASKQLGNEAGCPYDYYIFRCSTCGTVQEYATRPQGTLTGNTSGTGQLTYTSSNGGGPFTIVYQATGASPVTVNNISSTVAFNVVTPTTTTSYKLISVTDEITNASTDFSGISASIAVPYIVGQAALGGKIAYILQSGDPGYDANVQHGLVVTVADISSALGARWGCSGTSISTSSAIGTGNQNTINIMAGCATAGIAARLCGDLVQGGYSDWYLPSRNELEKLYLNKVAIGGVFGNGYWSSTESNTTMALGYYLRDGDQANDSKNGDYLVRAIRSF